MNLEQKQFEEWKRRHGKLNEGFLDGEEEEASADVPSEETTEETSEESEGDVIGSDEGSSEESDVDISEEPSEEGDSEESDDDFSEDEGSEEGTESMDDFGGDDNKEDGTSEDSNDTSELKDVMTSLTTAVQALTDKIETMSADKGSEGGEEAPAEEAPIEDGDDAFSDEGGEETTEEAPAEDEGDNAEGGDTSIEGGEGESTEDGEGDSTEGGDENAESSEGGDNNEAPADETKSEAFNFYHRKGSYLDENSDYIIGKLYENRYDKLEEPIMVLVKAKIRQQVEAYKKELRMAAIDKRLSK